MQSCKGGCACDAQLQGLQHRMPTIPPVLRIIILALLAGTESRGCCCRQRASKPEETGEVQGTGQSWLQPGVLRLELCACGRTARAGASIMLLAFCVLPKPASFMYSRLANLQHVCGCLCVRIKSTNSNLRVGAIRPLWVMLVERMKDTV